MSATQQGSMLNTIEFHEFPVIDIQGLLDFSTLKENENGREAYLYEYMAANMLMAQCCFY